MTEELRRRGFGVNHKRVERLMADNGLYAKDGRRRKVRTTIPDVSAPPLPDRLQRDFSVGEPGERACGDITYVGTDEGWLYLADVCDIGSRRVTGFAMADHMRTELVASALDMAVAARGGQVRGMVFHHDRGAQYLSREFRQLCERDGIAQSTGRTGSSHDNAVAESFWATLKRELVSRYRFASRADARRAIIAWINYYRRAAALVGRQRPAHRVGATLRTPRPAGRIAMCPAHGGKASCSLRLAGRSTLVHRTLADHTGSVRRKGLR